MVKYRWSIQRSKYEWRGASIWVTYLLTSWRPQNIIRNTIVKCPRLLIVEDKNLLVTFVQDVFKVDYIFLMKALHCIGGLHSENKTFSLTANMNSFAWKLSLDAGQEMVVPFMTWPCNPFVSVVQRPVKRLFIGEICRSWTLKTKVTKTLSSWKQCCTGKMPHRQLKCKDSCTKWDIWNKYLKMPHKNRRELKVLADGFLNGRGDGGGRKNPLIEGCGADGQQSVHMVCNLSGWSEFFPDDLRSFQIISKSSRWSEKLPDVLKSAGINV